MNIREQFEEIWPVPEGVEWSMNIGAYVCNDAIRITQELINKCAEMDARLDTFTRCQETTDVYVSLVDELVKEIEFLVDDRYNFVAPSTTALIDRAKQIMEQKK